MNFSLNKGKMLFVAAGLTFLVGCDGSVKSDPKNIAVQESSEVALSETALYLPGGGGVDFGVKPSTDKFNYWQGRKYRVLQYQISADYKELDKQLSEVLGNYGYVRSKDVTPKEGLLQVSFSHANSQPVNIKYSKVFKEGFAESVQVEIWWFLDN